MNVLIMVLQLIASLSILVILHEGGHFFAAKLFKTKVEKFYLFFNPWFTIFKFTKGETEYGLGWLPFGGYVKIAGMIDESFDREQMKNPVQPWEFRAKPAWQRLIIMLGGIIVNIILGIFIYIMLSYTYGKTYLDNAKVTTGIHVDSIGMKMGLKDGDRILKLGENEFKKFDVATFTSAIVLDGIKNLKVLRDGNEMEIKLPDDIAQTLIKSKDANIFAPQIPFTVAKITEGSVAQKSGIKEGDKIIALGETPVRWDYEVKENLAKYANKEFAITVIDIKKDTVVRQAKFGKETIFGVYQYGVDYYFELTKEKYSFFEAIPIGIKTSWDFISSQFKALGKMFQGKIKAKDSLGSVISIGKLFGAKWDVQRFWQLTAMLSLLLAFLNLLPIPGLDGGHAVFAIYEMISGKKPKDKFVEVATMIGFVLLIMLMIFALGNDFRNNWTSIVGFFKGIFS